MSFKTRIDRLAHRTRCQICLRSADPGDVMEVIRVLDLMDIHVCEECAFTIAEDLANRAFQLKAMPQQPKLQLVQ